MPHSQEVVSLASRSPQLPRFAQRTAIFDAPSLYEKLDAETLFFIFYNQPGSYQQYLVRGGEECGAGAGYCGWGWLARAQQRRQRGGKVGTLCCPSARCNALAPCPAAGGAGAEAAGLALPQAALGLVPGAPGPVGGAQRQAVPATCLTSQPLLRFPSTLCDASPPLCVPGLLPWRSGTRSPRRAASQATTGSRARECGPGPVLPLLCPGSLKWQVAYWLLALVCSLPPGVSAAYALPPTLNLPQPSILPPPLQLCVL